MCNKNTEYKYADVLLPLHLSDQYTYLIPEFLQEQIVVGQRVVVSFGPRRYYSGLVLNIHNNIPDIPEVKTIQAIIDTYPIVFNIQFEFWQWISKYYMCSLGDVMNASLPSSLKLSSETKVIINPKFDGDLSIFSEKEIQILNAVDSRNVMTITEISDLLGQAKVLHYIKNMVQNEALIIQEEILNAFKTKKTELIFLSKDYQADEKLHLLFTQLEKKAPKQLEVLLKFFQLTNTNKSTNIGVRKDSIVKSIISSSSAVATMIKKGIFINEHQDISRIASFNGITSGVPVLSSDQLDTFKIIKDQLEQKDVVVLHGVTSSGKTEIYCKLIEENLKNEKQVLFLLPEIALTAHLINRLRRYFGNKVGIYHSKFSNNERVEIWNSLLNEESLNYLNKYQIILGARSSLFLPFSNLGLIIVDEEHDVSYKQQEPAPRYHARDAAIYLAKLHNAKTILGSATPSYETYHNAISGKFGFAEIFKRFGGAQMPDIQIVNLKEMAKKKQLKSHFSQILLDEMNNALAHNQQIILFQNRRGFSIFLECDQCNFVPQCRNCDVSLIYHKSINKLKCHYCGYSIQPPTHCPDCNNSVLLMKGFGTEKIEMELPIFFPDARIARMDLDTTRSKNSYIQILNDFEDRNIDILVGTQMVTKGLDFDNVGLVGILNADSFINFPDFRSWERSFQLLSQVSGRAGRKNGIGKVIIQTSNPNHAVFKYVIENEFKSLYEIQMKERFQYKYPPYYRIIQISVRHKIQEIMNEAALNLAKLLRDKFGKRVLGPEYPVISRIKNEYIKNILIKFEIQASAQTVKTIINEYSIELRRTSDFRSVRIIIDVDPI